MTLMAHQPNNRLVQPHREIRGSTDLFGVLFAEVILPAGQQTTSELSGWPELPGWELRLWPVARLGDATLEARPLYPHLDAADLHCDLRQAGLDILGPVRHRR